MSTKNYSIPFGNMPEKYSKYSTGNVTLEGDTKISYGTSGDQVAILAPGTYSLTSMPGNQYSSNSFLAVATQNGKVTDKETGSEFWHD